MAAAVTNTPFQSGFRLVRGEDLNANFASPGLSTQQGVTAHSGGGRTNAFVVTASITNVTTVASGADSLVLPAAGLNLGKSFTIYNNGANALTLYGNGSDTINGIAGATGVSVAPGNVTVVQAIASGVWIGDATGGAVSSIVLDGATSGTTTLQASAIAGTTTQTFAPVTGTVASTSGSNLAIVDIYRGTALTITNSVTPTLIPGLAGTVAVGTYRIKSSIYCTPAATGGVSISFVLTTAVLSACNFIATAGAAAASITQATTTTTSTTNICAVATIPLLVQIEGTFVVSTAGTFSLFGCQNTQVNSAATINLGSTMELTRIA